MMTKAESYALKIEKLKDKLNVFVLCDGYDGWSWGMPVNPICLTYNEYETLLSKLKELFNFDLEKKIYRT